MRKGFSMIELVFVIVILGVLAAVAVPRFVATRTDAQVATLRSDASSALKAIVAKVFADNLDTKASLAPSPNDITKTPSIYWSQWILEVAGLDKGRWIPTSAVQNYDRYGVSPSMKYTGGYMMPCTTAKEGFIAIGKTDGDLYFNPQHLFTTTQSAGDGYQICKQLQESYKNSSGNGNRIIPLTSTQTIEF